MLDSLSVIVTAHNNAPVLPRTLQSLQEAIAFLNSRCASASLVATEIIAVNDGSTDATGEILERFAETNGRMRIVHRPQPSSPSCARNVGAKASSGSLLFFLDGDDLFFPDHLHRCCEALEDPKPNFIKTGVHLADPVHPDWKPRIEGSIVLNLCVRRHCHFYVGGFPDYHLFTRDDDRYEHATDVFYKFEDMYYNLLVTSLFTGYKLERETVQYVRYPGNSYDRQYEKFRQPIGAVKEHHSEEIRFRLRCCDLIFQEQLRRLRASRDQATAGGE
jgi:glycosyltransferase involved in cell wall biosynthesis